MITFEEAGVLLDAIAEEIPEEFFTSLNGGIAFLPDEKTHPEGVGDDLYILGEYHNDRVLGRTIYLYYGSFLRVFPGLPEGQMRTQLRKTLLHEFTHHVESLAGERGLERKDERRMEDYKRRRR